MSTFQSIAASALDGQSAPTQSARSQTSGANPIEMPDALETKALQIIDARDEMLRIVSPSTSFAIEEWVGTLVMQRTYTFAVPGQTVAHEDGSTRCRVSVNGREHFSLLPESYVWEFYFRIRATIARTANERGEREKYLRTLQKVYLPIPMSEVEAVLAVATETLQQVDVVHEQPMDEAGRLALSATVTSARNRLLRMLAPSSWRVVLGDVRRTHGGTTYEYPTGI